MVFTDGHERAHDLLNRHLALDRRLCISTFDGSPSRKDSIEREKDSRGPICVAAAGIIGLGFIRIKMNFVEKGAFSSWKTAVQAMRMEIHSSIHKNALGCRFITVLDQLLSLLRSMRALTPEMDEFIESELTELENILTPPNFGAVYAYPPNDPTSLSG